MQLRSPNSRSPSIRKHPVRRAFLAGRLDSWLLAGFLASLAAVRAGTLQESDPYWQARAGLENLAGAPLARPDSWSWAPTGGLFYQTSVGWNTLLGVAWQWAGFWGIFLAGLLAIGSYLALVALLAQQLGARPLPAFLGLLPVLALALPALSARATVLAQTLLLLGIILGWWWSERTARSPLWLNLGVVALGGFALSLLGNWIHLSWVVFAIALAGSWAILWFLTPGLGRAQAFALTLAGVVGGAAGVVLGPYGWEALARLEAVQRACAGLILEWTSMLDPGLALRWLPAALLGVWVGGASLKRVLPPLRRALAPSHDPNSRLILVLALLGTSLALGGVLAVRLIGIGLLLLAPLAAVQATGAVDSLRQRLDAEQGSRLAEWTSGRFWRIVLALVLAVLTPGTVLLTAPHSQPPDLVAFAQLPAGCRLYGVDTSGSGSVAVLLRPDVLVWTDGRADYYGRDRLRDALARITDPQPTDPIPKGATCVLVADYYQRYSLAPVVEAVDRDPSWRRLGKWGATSVWVPSEKS